MIKRIGQGLWGWLLRTSTQRTAGWLSLCVACGFFGMAMGFGLGVDLVGPLFGYNAMGRDHRIFSIWTWLVMFIIPPFFFGVWMLRHARRRERGLPPPRGTLFGGILESIQEIRKFRREMRRLAEEQEKKKAIFDAWTNR